MIKNGTFLYLLGLSLLLLHFICKIKPSHKLATATCSTIVLYCALLILEFVSNAF